ncbi:unnamed protein product [Penicillium salamii]|nr:unnamed protein product [Penicillium salamii]CAG8223408.1 unnamed protein product [Penicillium salamii]CAG8396802.1 unnamed protein product [Penicillium salamii]
MAKGIIWSLVVISGCIMGLGIGIMVWFAVRTDNPDIDLNSLEYASYKNTMFKDCYNTPMSNKTYDCLAIKASLPTRMGNTKYLFPSVIFPRDNITGYLNRDTISHNDTGHPRYSWCEVMSCFSDFKVIPSTPRPSAFWPTTLGVVNQATIILFFALWRTKNDQAAFYTTSPCKGIEWDDWLIMVWNLGSLIWWWIGLGRFLNHPDHYPAPFVLGWMSPWRYCDAINHHPYACALKPSRITARITRLTLSTLVVIQWAFSIYILGYMTRFAFGRGYLPHPAYECLASHIPDAPGTSSCSSEQLCSNEPIFYPLSPDRGETSDPMLLLSLFFVCFTIGAIPYWSFGVTNWCLRLRRSQNAQISSELLALLTALMGASCLLLVAGLVFLPQAEVLRYPPTGPVTIDWKCNALHVNLSPGRFYLDVEYQLPVRIAKMWFNA